MQRPNRRVEILRYLGIRSRATLRKWRALGLPVWNTPTGRLFAVRQELDAWRRQPGLRNKGVTREHPRGQNADSLSGFLKRLVDARAAGKTGER